MRSLPLTFCLIAAVTSTLLAPALPAAADTLPGAALPGAGAALPGALEPLDAEALSDVLTELLESHPAAKRTHLALKVTDLETGEVLFDRDSDKLFTPASNLKIYTSAAALALLGPESRPTLAIDLFGSIDDAGVFRGEMSLKPFRDGMLDTQGLRELLDLAIEESGMSALHGDLTLGGLDWPVGKGPGWMWDDDPDYYNAPISKAMLNFNTVAIRVSLADEDAEMAIELDPPTDYPRVKSKMPAGLYIELRNDILTTMSEEDWQRFIKQIKLTIDRTPGQDDFIITGALFEPGEVKGHFGVRYPPKYLLAVAKQLLVDRGIEYVFDEEALFESSSIHFAEGEYKPIVHVSKPGASIAEAVRHFLKKSENAVGEMLLLTLSEKFGKGEQVSWPSGAKVISDWLVEVAGLEAGSFRLVDGSGLSRYNLISADSSVRLLTYMKNDSPHFEPFFDGLPIYKVKLPSDDGAKWGGVPVAEFDAERVFAKPGGMSGVSTISGYVQTLDGRWLVFSFLGNGYIGSAGPVRDLRNAVWAELVRYQPAEVAAPPQ